MTYPGLPAPVIADHLGRIQSRAHYAPGTEFQIGKIEMVANTGTYVDAPFHRYPDGKDLAELPLERLADLDTVVVRALECGSGSYRGTNHRTTRAITAEYLRPIASNLAGKAVLFHTGWSRNWNTDRYGDGHPYLTRDAAECLVAANVSLVGIDSLNIDDDRDRERPVHTALLGADIPIVEHLTNLDAIPERGIRFFAVPVKVHAFGSFPVRAFAIAES